MADRLVGLAAAQCVVRHQEQRDRFELAIRGQQTGELVQLLHPVVALIPDVVDQGGRRAAVMEVVAEVARVPRRGELVPVVGRGAHEV